MLNRSILDKIIRVINEDAFDTARRVSLEEGVLIGISAGAAVWAALQLAALPENEGKLIVTVLLDSGGEVSVHPALGSSGLRLIKMPTK